MAKRIELTIKTTYVQNWGAWEGIRELVQNGIDAEREFNAPLTVDWSEGRGGTLRITNEGVSLPHEALLMGHTTKTGNDELIGQFGEGLKLGILALLRTGYHEVSIRSGSETWKPALEQSRVFDAEVISFYLQGGQKDRDQVRVKITGVDKETWEAMKPKFRFLSKEKKNMAVDTYHGTLLLDPKHKGKVYVKGIFVENDVNLEYGYDLKNAKLDRDRKMVDTWDRKWEITHLWQDALGQRPDLLDPFYNLLSSQDSKDDVEGFSTWPEYVPSEVRESLAARFTKQFGEKAIPVGTLSESREVEHLGAQGIVTAKPLREVLQKQLGNLEDAKRKLQNEVTHTYGWGELETVEKSTLTWAVHTLQRVEPKRCNFDIIDVVDFRSESLQGQHKHPRVKLAKKILTDERLTLEVLVHELAHEISDASDGTMDHVRAIENLWSRLVMSMC